jgi:hypothetical protein|tara:strand:+ start:208 stop:330 length:123 start_codon:yes stop_codon:yes gene_type:complete
MNLINKIPTWLAVSIITACLLVSGTIEYNLELQQIAGERQ